MQDVQKVFSDIEPAVKAAFLGLGKGPVTTQTIRFYSLFDQMTSRSKGLISCKSGCTYCCHYHVMVTATEVFALVEAIGRLPEAQRAATTSAVHQIADRTRKLTSDEYIHTNIPCALLKDGQCSVYSARPVACRGHHSADVRACKESFDDVHSEALAPKDYVREVTFQAFDNAQTAANFHARLDTNKYELHAALSEALSNPAAFKRWKAGKQAFPEVKDRVTLAERMSQTSN